MLAYVYALMDPNEEAVEHYRKTIHQSPTYVKAYYNLGNCYLKDGLLHEALEAYQTILELEPSHARAHFAIGQARARAGQWVEALVSFQRALSVRLDFPECHLAYARALEAVSRVREALHHYRSTSTTPPPRISVRRSVAIETLSRLGYVSNTIEMRALTAEDVGRDLIEPPSFRSSQGVAGRDSSRRHRRRHRLWKEHPGPESGPRRARSAAPCSDRITTTGISPIFPTKSAGR